MELRDYLRVVRRRWIAIAAAVVIAVVLTAAYTATRTPEYRSSARLFVSTSDSDQAQLVQGGQFSAQRVKSYADLVSSRELATRVIGVLGLDTTPSALAGQVSASVAVDTVNLTLQVLDPDAHEAQRIAQAYADQMVDLVRELETPSGKNTAPIKATIVDQASYSALAVYPNWTRNIGLAVIAGLVLGLVLAVLREVLDTRVNSAEDVADLTAAPTLGSIVQDPATARRPLITQLEPHAPRAESFRVLRTNLQFVDVDNDHKVFVITSAVPEEGKTTTAVNLALSLAQGGSRVLLIEGDLRRPKAASRLEFDDALGVTSVLVGRVKLPDVIQHDADTGLDFIAAGPVPPNPAELLQSQAMVDVIAQLRAIYDVILIDAPPLLPVTDAALIASKADGALLVLSHGKVTRDQVRISLDRLVQVDANLIGLVFNRVPAKGRRYGYGYGYGYGYAPTAEDDKSSGRAGRRAAREAAKEAKAATRAAVRSSAQEARAAAKQAREIGRAHV